MGRVRLLGDEFINRIAAGEVVQRPSSVVKELIENAIDAGAHRIDVVIRNGGLDFVEVSDDGAGMDEEDLLLAVERHATSKVQDDDLIFGATTLGFRGEALPSIGAVSHMSILSCQDLDSGATRVEIRGGRLGGVEQGVRARGTTVTVRRLFHNTPARRKFLKSPAAEATHCRSVITAAVLTHPQIAFTYRVDNRLALTSPGDGNLMNTIVRVFGTKDGTAMVPVEERSHPSLPITVTGAVSSGVASRSSPGGIVLSVNGRAFHSHPINRLLQEVYGPYLKPRRWPMAVLFLKADPRIVDVNVHPSKHEVRFSFFGKVRSFLASVLNDTLGRAIHRDTPCESATTDRTDGSTSHPPSDSLAVPHTHATPAARLAPPSRSCHPSLIRSDDQPGLWLGSHEHNPRFALLPPQGRTTDEASPSMGCLADQLTILGQVLSTYIVASSPNGLFLVDQHAAHERVLYEGVLQRSKAPDRVQRLLIPPRLPLPPDVINVVSSLRTDFLAVGIDMSVEGDTVVINTLPSLYEGQDAESLVLDLVEGFTELTDHDETESLRTAAAAMVACKGAVKAGQPLSMSEMNRLLHDLSRCQHPSRCPHGRPTIVEMTRHQLDVAFGRS